MLHPFPGLFGSLTVFPVKQILIIRGSAAAALFPRAQPAAFETLLGGKPYPGNRFDGLHQERIRKMNPDQIRAIPQEVK
jgi:hypothetical protein